MLIISALSLFVYNKTEDVNAGKAANVILNEMHSQINTLSKPNLSVSDNEVEDEEATTVEIGGDEYIGYLSIPTLELELPVMSSWDYAKLRIAPCREQGEPSENNLVIAAHNYDTHFGRIKQLVFGAAVEFTDVNGKSYEYIVEKCETLQPDMVEAVLDSEYDLVLYTCTKGGATRIAVFCNKTEY